EGRAFDEVKAILNSSFRVGPSLENAHSIYLFLEDITKYELIDPQPLIEYMSPDNTELLQKPFVYSMIKVSKMSIQTRKQITGGVNAEYELSPKIAVTAGTGVGTEHTSEDAGYNVFVGQKFMEGAQWVDNFHDAPKVDIVLIKPLKDAVIDQVQARVQGHILQYHLIPENFQNKLQLYIMVQNEYEDDWILQSKARVDMNGYFEAILKLGTLEEGNGHRYSISAFATYFKINREVNSTIPFLPFNKGQYIINVKRQDRDF
ncbi:MAG TPA: hypothetical protein PLR86_00260, partial [Planctomycetota bacterium]|nr:hypothetical protein [Planctomycetota bacterium]